MTRLLASILTLSCCISLVSAAVPVITTTLERIPDSTASLCFQGNQLVESATGDPRVLFMRDEFCPGQTPEEISCYYLDSQVASRSKGAVPFEYRHVSTRETPGGYHVRFVQYVENLPVYHSTSTITLNRNRRVTFATLNWKKINTVNNMNGLIDSTRALSVARRYLNASDKRTEQVINKLVFVNAGDARIVWQVMIALPEQQYACWEILVDAHSGEVIRAENVTYAGEGAVFDPEPVSQNQGMYGEGELIDNLDADNFTLTASLIPVDLGELLFTAGQYKLANEYAVIIDGETPHSGLFLQETDDFSCSRGDDRFEAVMCFYYITEAMAYINEELGYEVMPLQYEGGVQFDPDGVSGYANAHYMPMFGSLGFGSNRDAVDAGEDVSIIFHELMHGVHDWITDRNITNNTGLSEGCSDYWGQSYCRSLGFFNEGDMQYDWFNLWGLRPMFGTCYMRVTNYTGHYPENLTGDVHTDGQMWSSSLMSIYNQIGRTTTDILLLEALSMLDDSADQRIAALAFLQADVNLYDSENLSVIVPVFHDRGYIESTLYVNFSADIRTGPPPLEVQFEDHSFSFEGIISSWEWDFNGDGITDSNTQHPGWTYTEPGSYNVSLIVSDGELCDTLIIPSFIAVNQGILVFDAPVHSFDLSGGYIADFLTRMQLPEITYTHNFPFTLEGYDGVFLTYGNSPDSTYDNCAPSVDEILTMMDYIASGGQLYLEAGCPFYTLNYDLELFLYMDVLEAFGAESSHMYYTPLDFDSLTGGPGSITEGMTFYETNQVDRSVIEFFHPYGADTVLFEHNTFGPVGLQNANEAGGRSICLTYSSSRLVDQGMSTRDHFLSRVAYYFDILEFAAKENPEIIPVVFELGQAYPNPFNSITRIPFSLPESGIVRFSVYNLLGQEVATLMNTRQNSGMHHVIWRGTDNAGYHVASGMYLLRLNLQADSGNREEAINRVILLR